MSIDELAETIQQRIAQSQLIQGETGDVRRGLRIRGVIEGIVREAGVVLSEGEKKALVKRVSNSESSLH